MERLTMRDVGGRAFWVSPQSPGGGYRLTEDAQDQKRLDRLAAYEDAMTLERAQELAQAEQDGRLVVLPYKIGDLVYRIAVRKKYLNCSMCTPYIKSIEITTENDMNDIGKSVFLTREEAEAALKKREDDNEAD